MARTFEFTPETAAAPVAVSVRAARRIAELLAQEADPNQMFRVSVEGGGCSGFQYRFDFDRRQKPDDLVIEAEGATVLIDPSSAAYLANAEIDFVTDLMGASFQVHNPNAKSSCGCGTSFSL
jgi:iron-sulfur cluster assembly accessory protein